MIAYMLWHPLILKYPANYPWEMYINREISYLDNVTPAQTFRRIRHDWDAAQSGEWVTYRVELRRIS